MDEEKQHWQGTIRQQCWVGTTALSVDKSNRQGTALCVDIRNEQGMAWEEGVIRSSISRARVAALGGGQQFCLVEGH